MNGFAKQSARLGEWLLRLLTLQFYWVLHTLKGGVIFGFFPATGGVFKIIYQWLSEPKEEQRLKVVFGSYVKEHYWELNKLGYLLGGALGLIVLDLQVSKHFIHSYALHYFLVALFIVVLGTALYVLPIYSRYNLATLQYIKQAFFFFFTNIIETVAMLIGFFLVVVGVTFLPILLIVGGVPLFSLPISWFAYQGMKKVELKKLRI